MLHNHPRSNELFYVLAGVTTILIDGKRRNGAANTMAVVQRWRANVWQDSGDSSDRMPFVFSRPISSMPWRMARPRRWKHAAWRRYAR